MKLFEFKGDVPLGWRKQWGRFPSGGITEDLCSESEPRWIRFRYSIPGTSYSFIISETGIVTSRGEQIEFCNITHVFLPETKEEGDFALLEDVLCERLAFVNREQEIQEVFLGMEGQVRSIFNWCPLCNWRP